MQITWLGFLASMKFFYNPGLLGPRVRQFGRACHNPEPAGRSSGDFLHTSCIGKATSETKPPLNSLPRFSKAFQPPPLDWVPRKMQNPAPTLKPGIPVALTLQPTLPPPLPPNTVLMLQPHLNPCFLHIHMDIKMFPASIHLLLLF